MTAGLSLHSFVAFFCKTKANMCTKFSPFLIPYIKGHTSLVFNHQCVVVLRPFGSQHSVGPACWPWRAQQEGAASAFTGLS